MEGLDEEQMSMMKLMGFAGFNTTKGKKVEGNDVSGVQLQRKRRYRQYMNRRGGFNRPLDFVA
jgi:U4/U6.U5 tri-snRNP-associated protein 3